MSAPCSSVVLRGQRTTVSIDHHPHSKLRPSHVPSLSCSNTLAGPRRAPSLNCPLSFVLRCELALDRQNQHHSFARRPEKPPSRLVYLASLLLMSQFFIHVCRATHSLSVQSSSTIFRGQGCTDIFQLFLIFKLQSRRSASDEQLEMLVILPPVDFVTCFCRLVKHVFT